MHDLFKLIDEHNAVGLVTNQVMSNPAVFFGDPTKPIGGNIVGHTATFRLYLRKSKANVSPVSWTAPTFPREKHHSWLKRRDSNRAEGDPDRC